MAKKAGIPIQKSGGMEVMVANGDKLPSSVFCMHVLLSIQEISVCTDFYLLN